MARKAGQLISRGSRTWLVRISLGRDPETGTRKYHNKTVRGSFREAQTYLNGKLQEREIGRLPRAAAISLNQYLDQWLTTAAKPRLRPEKLYRLRSAVAASLPPNPRDKAARRNRPIRHPERLRSNV
jgi:hypothetical protein